MFAQEPGTKSHAFADDIDVEGRVARGVFVITERVDVISRCFFLGGLLGEFLGALGVGLDEIALLVARGGMGFCGDCAESFGQSRTAARSREVAEVKESLFILGYRRKEAFYSVATRTYALDGRKG